MPLLPPDAPARPPTRVDHILVGTAAVGAAIGAVLASGEPAGWRPADVVWRAAFAAIVVLAGAKARRWTWLAAAAVGAAAAPSLLVAAPALVGLAIAVVNASVGRRARVVGAVVVALAVQSLLRLELDDPHGLATLVAAAGVLPVLVSGYRRSSHGIRRTVKISMAGFVVVAIGLAAAQAFVVVQARSSVAEGIDAARAGFEAARSGEEDAAVDSFSLASASFEEANDTLSAPWAMAGRAVPLLGQHARAVEEITASGSSLAATAAGAAGESPIDELEFTDGVLDLTQVAAFAAPLARAESALIDADETVTTVDSGWLVGPLADRVDEFAAEIDEARPQAELARRGVDVAPGLFGGDGLRRYFIAFVTPAEQRAGGGFMGNFGVLTANNGDVHLGRSQEIRGLQNPLVAANATLTEPADYVARYGRFAPHITPGDVTLSPDFPSIASVIGDLFPQSGGQPLDGVILVDPFALEAFLTFTGPISVTGYPTPLDSRNAADILLREQYLTFDDREGRKDFLEEASRRTFEALTSGDLPGPRRVGEVLGPMVDEGRLLVHSFHPEEQAFFDQVGLDGAFPNGDGGDMVGVTTQNSGHNKGDSFLTREVDYEATVDPDTGRIEATATVTLVNAAPAGGLPDVIIGVNPALGTPDLPALAPGTNLMYLTLYSPHALDGADVDGVDLAIESQEELGLNAYSQYVAVPPGATVTVTFDLIGGVDLADGYRLTVAGQATINPDDVSVSVGLDGPWIFGGGDGVSGTGDRMTGSWTDSVDHVLAAEIESD
jgi:hypothetical protein